MARLFLWALAAGFAANAFLTDDESRPRDVATCFLAALFPLRFVRGLTGTARAVRQISALGQRRSPEGST